MFSFFHSTVWTWKLLWKMSAPKLEDLPKVADDLKSQLEGFTTDKLKEAHTQEKIVLPTAEGMFLTLIPCSWALHNNSLFIRFRCCNGKDPAKFDSWNRWIRCIQIETCWNPREESIARQRWYVHDHLFNYSNCLSFKLNFHLISNSNRTRKGKNQFHQ